MAVENIKALFERALLIFDFYSIANHEEEPVNQIASNLKKPGHNLLSPNSSNASAGKVASFAGLFTADDKHSSVGLAPESTSGYHSGSNGHPAGDNVHLIGGKHFKIQFQFHSPTVSLRNIGGGRIMSIMKRNRSDSKGGLRRKSKTENRARKALRTITIILGAFVLFWTPFYGLATLYGFCYDGKGGSCVPNWLYVTSYYFCYINSTINPFCYALANAQFKKTFLRILRGDWHRA